MGLGGGRKNGLLSPGLSCVVYCLSATHSCVSQTRVKAQPRLASSSVSERTHVVSERSSWRFGRVFGSVGQAGTSCKCNNNLT